MFFQRQVVSCLEVLVQWSRFGGLTETQLIGALTPRCSTQIVSCQNVSISHILAVTYLSVTDQGTVQVSGSSNYLPFQIPFISLHWPRVVKYIPYSFHFIMYLDIIIDDPITQSNYVQIYLKQGFRSLLRPHLVFAAHSM